MYAGYVWLTSNLDLGQLGARLVLLAGMAGFFVIALSVPNAFGTDQFAQGIAYLWVVVHAVMFALKAGQPSAQAIKRIAPFNVAAGTQIWLLLAIGAGTLVVEGRRVEWQHTT
jgi:low temperature requirement protein LtrA